jgi:predicted transcriptional regulator
MTRKCKDCGRDVEVLSKLATKVLCKECKSKKNNDYPQILNVDTDDFIYCRFCGLVRKSLSHHIKKFHKITEEQYLQQFGDVPIQSKNLFEKRKNRSQESRDRVSLTSKQAWQDSEYRKKQIERLRNQHREPWKMSKEGVEHIKEGQNKSVKMQARRERKKQNEFKRKEEIRTGKESLKEFVLCPLCLREGKDEIGSRFECLTFKHLKSHNYSSEQFKNEFKDFKFKIDRLRKEHSECLSGENHFNYGKKYSDELKQNISKGVIETWDEHNPKKICPQCGTRMLERNEKEVCKNCMFKIYGFEDTNEYVYCRICFRINGNLTQHIVNDHHITTEAYKETYQCEIYSKNNRDAIGKHLISIPITEHHRNAIKQFNIRKNIEKIRLEDDFKNENYTFLLERKIPFDLEDTYDFVYCRYCLRQMKFVSSEHLFNHNLTVWMYHQLFPDVPLFARSVINRVVSKGVATKIRLGTLNLGCYGYSGYRKDIGHFTRSMVEANFCRILIYNNVKYEYEPKTFPLEHEIYSSYTPDILLLQDFYAWKEGTFLELKNRGMDEDNEKKMNVFFEKFPEVVLVVLDKSSQEVVNLERLYRHKIDLWETSERNIETTPELYV